MSAPVARAKLAGCAAVLWLLPGTTLAKDATPSTPADLLAAMHQALADGDQRGVSKLYKKSRKLLLKAENPVPTAVQAEAAMVAGMALWTDGDPDGAMDAWRVTLELDPAWTWDTSAYPDDDAETVFCALGHEVDGRARQSPGLPLDLGSTEVWIGGQPATAATTVPRGTYLVQAQCADGAMSSTYWHSDKALDIHALCPDGLGESAIADDECDGGFDMFGNPIDCKQDPVADVHEEEGVPE